MGYQTYFSGQFDLDKPLTAAHKQYLEAFNQTRRMARKPEVAETFTDPKRLAAGLPIGDQGSYYVGSEVDAGQNRDASIIDYNNPPMGQPGLWCQWRPIEEGTAIGWDNGEKFYNYTAWIEYLINHFLGPWGYVVNGEVIWSGEEDDDKGTIHVKNNQVRSVSAVIVHPKPEWE